MRVPGSTGGRIVVVGAGAAGSMAAIAAAEAARESGLATEVLLLERTADGGRKILISGGGRCNILPASPDLARFVTDSSSHSLRKILRNWPHAEQVRFFNERMQLDLTLEEESGKFFPASNRARDVRDGLLSLAARLGVRQRFNCTVTGLARSSDGRWVVALAGGDTLPADAVILATGGLSVPNTGSDGTGLRLAREFGHAMQETYAALTPLTGNEPTHATLAGISRTVTLAARADGRLHTARGGFLFTHRGYSGPSVLDLSHLAVRARMGGRTQEITVQWAELDGEGWDAQFRAGGTAHVGTLIKRELPERLAEMVLMSAGVEGATPASQLRREDRQHLVAALTRMPLPWTGDEGYRKAEVTGGGVSLAEVNPATMESRREPGLFLCGEMLDAFGPIGGYNFMWAWATGRAAGLGAVKNLVNGER